jgi:kynureninase
LPGWLGHADPFAFAEFYEPATGAQRFVCGTPPILSLQALDAALDIWQGIDLSRVRHKSLVLGDAFLRLASERLSDHGIEIASPLGEERGSQVSLRHKEGHAIMQALIHRRVVGDFRAPDLLRFGLCPLFLRHTDIWDAVEVLRDILATGAYNEERYQRRDRVT